MIEVGRLITKIVQVVSYLLLEVENKELEILEYDVVDWLITVVLTLLKIL